MSQVSASAFADTKPHYKILDGLRGVAALTVVCFHIFEALGQSVYGAMITKKVTLELRNDGSIVQARGVANRIMKAEERHIVKTWASRNGLYLAC